MSAFIVSNETINAMLQARHLGAYPGNGLYYRWADQTHYFNGNVEVIGQKLTDENYRSVNYRYSEHEAPCRFQHIVVLQRFTATELIKICDCYRYQTCETPDWSETEAHAIMTALRERAIRNIPGYSDAPWGL